MGRWQCSECQRSFRVLSGTVFEATRVPLRKWFIAIALIVNAKKSLSSYQLSRELSLSQKTAWYLAMRIRRAMQEGDVLLGGIVEADESYVGGRGGPKLCVLGAVSRDGEVVARLGRPTARDAWDFLSKVVSPYARLMTDESNIYLHLDEYFAQHESVRHNAWEFARGEVSTNRIEGFWAGLKRAWRRTHHWYSAEWALWYVVEAASKYNVRDLDDPFDYLLTKIMLGD